MGDGIIMASKREIAQAETDREWWQAVGEPCGWRIYGWSYRDTAHLSGGRRCQPWRSGAFCLNKISRLILSRQWRALGPIHQEIVTKLGHFHRLPRAVGRSDGRPTK